MVKNSKAGINYKINYLLSLIVIGGGNELLVLFNNTFGIYLKTKKGLTYVGPGDGEPYF